MGRATRGYRALRGLPHSTGNHNPQVLPAGVARGTEEALHEAPRYSRKELEVLGFGRPRTQVLGRLHARIRRSDSRHRIAACTLVRGASRREVVYAACCRRRDCGSGGAARSHIPEGRREEEGGTGDNARGTGRRDIAPGLLPEVWRSAFEEPCAFGALALGDRI